MIMNSLRCECQCCEVERFVSQGHMQLLWFFSNKSVQIAVMSDKLGDQYGDCDARKDLLIVLRTTVKRRSVGRNRSLIMWILLGGVLGPDFRVVGLEDFVRAVRCVCELSSQHFAPSHPF